MAWDFVCVRRRRWIRTSATAVLWLVALAAHPPSARPDVLEEQDGRHDFEWEIGKWKIHARRLEHPLSGSERWIDLDGTVTVRRIWDGSGNLAEVDLAAPSGRLQFISLRLYDAKSRQWSLNFATSGTGSLSVPMVGHFEGGRGEFYDQEPFEGKSILVRFVFFPLQGDSGRSEQAFSGDWGKTWEVNWVNTYTRVKD